MKEWICEEVPAITIDGKVLSTFLHQERELIRCKDCKHYEPDDYCIGHGDCNGACDNLIKVSDNWFCPDAERRTE